MPSLFKDIGTILFPKEKKRLLFFIVADIFTSLADIFSMGLLVLIVSFYAGQSNSALPIFLRLKDMGQYTPALAVLLFFVIKNSAAYLIQKQRYKFIYEISLRLSAQNLNSYLTGNYESYNDTDSAVHIRTINHQPVEFCNYVLLGLQQISTEVFLITFALTGLALVNLSVFLMLCTVIVPSALIVFFIIKKRAQQVRMQIQQANNNTLQYLSEAIDGYVESNIYKKDSFFTNRYQASLQSVNHHLIQMQLMQKIAPVIMELFGVAGMVFLVIQSQQGTANILILGAFIAAAYKIIPGVARIMSAGALVKTFEYTVQGLLDQRPKTEIEVKPFSTINNISFRDINFSYGENKILSDLTFTVCKGTLLAYCGNSGIGKTTLLDLLLGFKQPRSGEILINDNESSLADRRSLWQQVAYVKQKNFLLHASLRTNITLSEDEHDDNRLSDVIEAAGLLPFLQTLPAGIETIITQDGRNISGGQRQRIAVARALYKDADLIILDEPFNELDQASMISMIQVFKQKANEGKIILLVTHNKEAAALCDETVNI